MPPTAQTLDEEFDLPVLIQCEEYTKRKSTLVYEISDELIAEASERKDIVDDKNLKCVLDDDESDEEVMYTLAADQQGHLRMSQNDDDDDLSLAEESYIRSGQMSGALDTQDLFQQLEKDKEDAKKKARVRFAVNERTGKLLCHVHEASIKRLRKSEREMCWYTKKDFKEFKMSMKDEMTEIRRSSYYLHFIKIFAACSSSDLLRGLTQKHAVQLADTPFRGFELQIFSAMLLTHRKHTHVQFHVVQSQHKNLGQTMTVSERWEALGERCRKLTKQNRRLASLYGSGDAIVARFDDVELRHWLKRASNKTLALAASFISASPLCSPTSSQPKSPLRVIRHTKSSQKTKKLTESSESPTATGSLSLGLLTLNLDLTKSPKKSHMSPAKRQNQSQTSPIKTKNADLRTRSLTNTPTKNSKREPIRSNSGNSKVDATTAARESPTRSPGPKRVFQGNVFTVRPFGEEASALTAESPTNRILANTAQNLPSSPDLMSLPRRTKSNPVQRSPRRAVIPRPSFKASTKLEL